MSELARWDHAKRLQDRLGEARQHEAEMEQQVMNLQDALAYEQQQIERLREALRPFAESWDFHAADYLAERVDGEECRIIPARVVAEMIDAVHVARAALADTGGET